MQEKAPFYITTAITYPNALPHIGHALEYVQADFLARYYKLQGREVRFQTGLDEHGLKVQESAAKASMTPEAFVEQQSKAFEQIWTGLQIGADRFIRTTDSDHQNIAQAFWTRCAKNQGPDGPDIYKKVYKAWYNSKEEEFLGFYEDYPDPAVFDVKPEFIRLIEEENYFFRLSRYTDQLIEILKQGDYEVLPLNRRKEMLNFAKDKGLTDVSISRDCTKLSWGIPVPNDPSQVMYVWYDALTNYLTGAASTDQDHQIQLSEFWPADLHCVGKDIIRFHALLWPAMLLSAKLPLPKRLIVHGFLLSNGQKMSKSLGTGIDPLQILQKYGSDPLRWFLLSQVPTLDDADFTESRLREIHNADLANDYGNLASRVLNMVKKYLDGHVPSPNSGALTAEIESFWFKTWDNYTHQIELLQIDQALAEVKKLVEKANCLVDEYKPWVLAKEEKLDQLEELLYILIELIRGATFLIKPAIPNASKKVADLFFAQSVPPEAWESFADAKIWGTTNTQKSLGEPPLILFPRLEEQ